MEMNNIGINLEAMTPHTQEKRSLTSEGNILSGRVTPGINEIQDKVDIDKGVAEKLSKELEKNAGEVLSSNKGDLIKEIEETDRIAGAGDKTDNRNEIEGELHRAFFALDDENVVIRIIDKKGNTLKQIPPEEYLKMAERVKDNRERLFHMEV